MSHPWCQGAGGGRDLSDPRSKGTESSGLGTGTCRGQRLNLIRITMEKYCIIFKQKYLPTRPNCSNLFQRTQNLHSQIFERRLITVFKKKNIFNVKPK